MLGVIGSIVDLDPRRIDLVELDGGPVLELLLQGDRFLLSPLRRRSLGLMAPREMVGRGRPRPAVVAADNARRSLGAPFGWSGGPRPTTVEKFRPPPPSLKKAIFGLTKRHSP